MVGTPGHARARLGPILPVVQRMLHMSSLRTRADLERLAMGLQTMGV
jgi:hypothetical protein